MPSKWFDCPAGRIEIAKCLKPRGCPLKDRCAPLPYLRAIAFDREWRGITPSMAGNGPRQVYLKRVTDYAINPGSRAFAILGIKVHEKLARDNFNALTEEQFADAQSKGIIDRLVENEYYPGEYDIWDWKTWGCFKVMKAIGRAKGEDKLYHIDPALIEDKDFALQVNRYRRMAEGYGFKIRNMFIFTFIRDATGKNKSIYQLNSEVMKIPIRYISNSKVLEYYTELGSEVQNAMITRYARKCNTWESWNGKRCDGYCEVKESCNKMDNGKK